MSCWECLAREHGYDTSQGLLIGLYVKHYVPNYGGNQVTIEAIAAELSYSPIHITKKLWELGLTRERMLYLISQIEASKELTK